MKRCSAFLLVCCWVCGFGAARVFSQQPQVGKNSLVSEYVNEHLPNWLNIEQRRSGFGQTLRQGAPSAVRGGANPLLAANSAQPTVATHTERLCFVAGLQTFVRAGAGKLLA